MTVSKDSLAMEIACALKDVFVAEVEAENENVFIRFVDGTKYQLTVKEN